MADLTFERHSQLRADEETILSLDVRQPGHARGPEPRRAHPWCHSGTPWRRGPVMARVRPLEAMKISGSLLSYIANDNWVEF